MPEEPADNISVGGSGRGTDVEFEPAAAETHAEAVVDELGERYWTKTYGGRDAFECLVRTILSQNTSDTASQPAHDSLMDRYGPEGDDSDADLAVALATAERSALAETISHAGLYNQKSEVIVGAAEEIVAEFGGEAEFDAFVREEKPETVRNRLLNVRGVGPKTADCVLLFSGGRAGVFPVDTHVHRVARRVGLAPADADHEAVRARLEADLPPEKCGFGHTAMLQFGREYCSARKPACLDGPEACPLSDDCDRVGVDDRDGTVVDPAEAE